MEWVADFCNIGDIDVNVLTIIAMTVIMLWHYHIISFSTCINSCVGRDDLRKLNNSLHNCLPGVIPLHSLIKKTKFNECIHMSDTYVHACIIECHCTVRVCYNECKLSCTVL